MSTRDRERAVLMQAASLLLQYPDDDVLAALPTVGAALRGLPSSTARRELLDFAATAAATEPRELQEHYVATLDRNRRCCMYLTWWTEGETRRRGMAMAELKQLYRRHGLELVPDELPDFLPVVLELGASGSPGAVQAALDVLQARRAGLELLRLALVEVSSPYAGPVTAVCSLLPGPSPKDEAAARALAATGPPTEDVGLEPFAVLR